MQQAGISRNVHAVRAFNRFYTQQIGVLHEGLVNSEFSLTEVRVLYELAHHRPQTATELCQRLGLDAGYLSRILRGFENKSLISRAPSAVDGRQSNLALTKFGRDAFAPLDARSSQQALAMLKKLSAAQQAQLVRAMQTISQVLQPESATTAPYILRSHRPGDMGWVVHRHGVLYSQEYGYDERFEALVASIVADFVQNLDSQRERCWIAERNGENVACIFLVKKSKTVAKLRTLLVEPSARGLGIGRRLVRECVTFARQAGYKKIILWTQSELKAARHLYQEAGFKLAGKKRHSSWGQDHLVAEVWELKL
jgi:DNA-binding MarR family transcriptional regulator/N-acetylglutamate synthase-like GNAT family acetyltransferase